ncbi:hypothetical protein EK21DRAFT_115176 [Setomelanomma holmii]|uniref:Uncharacterized protein n=1 Tax=Setomelanomma holmii TaxID=210430 RepID=A0A9P4H3S8_9PLEO|nr:hypothetical protein EK21DRAFT_115176 [Setomelanomma holmii]
MEVRCSHDGPEAVPHPPQHEQAQYPFYVPQDPQLASRFGPHSPPPQYAYGHNKEEAAAEVNTAVTPPKHSHRKWWIIGIAAFIVVAAAVGGRIGGTLGEKKKGDKTR